MNKFILFLKKPVIIGVIAVLVIVGIGFLYFNRSGNFDQQFAITKRQDISEEVNVTGRIKATESVDLAFNITGKVVWTPVDVGDKVGAWKALMQLDSREAERNVRDREIDLENAKLALQKISLEQGQIVRGDTLNKAYEEGLRISALLFADFSI